jgi:hypothetical protein
VGSSASPPPSKAVRRAEPTLVFAAAESAYHARLVADDTSFHLLTPTAAYHLAPGQAPRKIGIELGDGASGNGESFVYWSNGAVYRAFKSDPEKPLRLGALSSRPQGFFTSGDDVCWLERAPDDRFRLMTFVRGKPTPSYESPGKLDAATMLSDWLFFVERPAGFSWRIGGVPVRGGTPTFTRERNGRAPAMLVARRDLYYYDGNSREVRRLSPDLAKEETLVRGFICTPLAVFEHVYCAQLEGIFELRQNERPLLLSSERTRGPVIDLAANRTHVAWLSEAGAERLEVRSLALSERP